MGGLQCRLVVGIYNNLGVQVCNAYRRRGKAEDGSGARPTATTDHWVGERGNVIA